MTPTLSLVEALARQAGEILRQGFSRRPGFGRRIRIDPKGQNDLVTEIDHQSEAFLISEIRRRFPSHRVMAEESGETSGNDCCIWYIDPLDGTINYAHGVPIFSVSIAYEEEGLMRFGAVYDPSQDECFTAERGKGAWLNGDPIHVSQIENLENSLLVTGFPYDAPTRPDNNLNHFNRFTLLTQGVRRLGSAALDLSYVAAGRVDGFWEIRLSPWDVAAGGLIVEEAGGTVTNLQGSPNYLSRPQSILAANPSIQPKMLKTFYET
jgi:myo-inositol-1(or 4)-monophosphatase